MSQEIAEHSERLNDDAHLPEDLWGQVFSFLNSKEVAVASCVCKPWCRAAAEQWERCYFVEFGDAWLLLRGHIARASWAQKFLWTRLAPYALHFQLCAALRWALSRTAGWALRVGGRQYKPHAVMTQPQSVWLHFQLGEDPPGVDMPTQMELAAILEGGHDRGGFAASELEVIGEDAWQLPGSYSDLVMQSHRTGVYAWRAEQQRPGINDEDMPTAWALQQQLAGVQLMVYLHQEQLWQACCKAVAGGRVGMCAAAPAATHADDAERRAPNEAGGGLGGDGLGSSSELTGDATDGSSGTNGCEGGGGGGGEAQVSAALAVHRVWGTSPQSAALPEALAATASATATAAATVLAYSESLQSLRLRMLQPLFPLSTPSTPVLTLVVDFAQLGADGWRGRCVSLLYANNARRHWQEELMQGASMHHWAGSDPTGASTGSETVLVLPDAREGAGEPGRRVVLGQDQQAFAEALEGVLEQPVMADFALYWGRQAGGGQLLGRAGVELWQAEVPLQGTRHSANFLIDGRGDGLLAEQGVYFLMRTKPGQPPEARVVFAVDPEAWEYLVVSQ